MLTPDLKTRIKVKEIFDHPWFRHFENLELEKAKTQEQKRIPSHNLKLSEFDYTSNQKPENNNNYNNKIIISNKNVILSNNNTEDKNSSSRSLVNFENFINQEGNPNPIDSYKSSMGLNLIAEDIPASQNFISANYKNKVNLKDLKKENPVDEVISGLIDNNQKRKNKSNDKSVLIGLGKSLNEESKSHNNYNNLKEFNSGKFDVKNIKAVNNYNNNNTNNKEYENETIETIEAPNQGKTKIIIKKKKKILIAKTPTYNEKSASNQFVINHLLEGSENNFIENYKAAKISSVLKKNTTTTTSSNYNNKSELSNKNNTKDNSNSYLDSFHDFKSNANKLSSDKNQIKSSLNNSKNLKNSSNLNNFASEKNTNNNKIKNNINNNNKSSNKTANDILLRSFSPNNNIPKNNDNNNNNFKRPSDNFNTDKKPNLDFSDGGYDLENFIQQQNAKKSKIANHISRSNNNNNNDNNYKSPGYKDNKYLEKFNSKSHVDTNKHSTNNHKLLFENELNEKLNIQKFQNENFLAAAENSNSEDNEQQYENKFSKLIQMNNKNKMEKSMDRSFNEFSRDQIKEKINYKKNKSILNALNKTENEIEKFDNNQMNSSVIDVVFSKIEGKNKNKNKQNKDYGKLNVFNFIFF